MVWAAITVAATLAARRLQFDFNFVSLFESNDPSVARFQDYRERFGDDASYVAAIIQSDRIFTPQVLSGIQTLGASFSQTRGIKRTVHLMNFKVPQPVRDGFEVRPLVKRPPSTLDAAEELKEKALGHPLMNGALVSPDGTTAAVIAEFDDDVESVGEREVIQRELDRRAGETLSGLPVTFFLTGIPVIQQRYKDLIFSEQVRFVPVAAAILLLFVYAFLRRPAFIPIAVVPVTVSVVWTLGIMALSGRGVNIMNQVIPVTLMVVGIADAIHLLVRYQEELVSGRTQQGAILKTVSTLGKACFLTSFTTAVGFFSLLSAHAKVVRELGWYAGLGVMLAYLNTIVLVPILLTFTQSPAPSASPRPAPGTSADSQGKLSALLGRIGHSALTHPRIVFVSVALLTLTGALAALRAESHHRILEEILPSDPVYRGVMALEEKLSGLLSFAVVVDGGHEDAILEPGVLRALEDAQRFLEEAEPEFISRTLSVADVVREIHGQMAGDSGSLPAEKKLLYQYLLFLDRETLEPFVDEGFRRAAIRVRGKDLGSERWLKLKPALEKRLTANLPKGYRVSFTGASDLAITTLTFIVHDMLVSLSWSFVMIFGIIILLFRSARVGLISILPNILPLLTTLGLMGLAGVPIRTASVIIFTVSLGIAVDNTIHFIARYHEERGGGLAPREAAEKSLHTSGRAMTISTLMLVSGLGVFLFSNFRAVLEFGIFGGWTLLVALVLDLVVTPVLFVAFDRR